MKIGKEYNARQKAATERLRKLGALEKARTWLRENRPPKGWQGTPMEYAETEMPLPFGALLKRLFS